MHDRDDLAEEEAALADALAGVADQLRRAGTGRDDEARQLAEQLDAGARCRIEYRGTTWTAINSGEEPIPSGRNAVIEEMDGLTLRVRICSN